MGPTGDMDPRELRRAGHEVFDWIASYVENVDEHDVLPRIQPGDVTAKLPASPPAQGEPIDDILRDFREILVPGMTHWNHPGFHGYFANTGSGPGILAEALSATLNANAMVWRSAPAATELEGVACDWVRQLMGLPEGFEGHINDTASVSTLVALAAARHRATQGEVRTKGLAGLPRLRMYCSEEAHSSVEKAAIILGLGQEGCRKIPVDDEFVLRADLLEQAIEEDRANGWVPMAIVATFGTTSTTSMDPVAACADLAERHGMWLHVDAAYGGGMALVPEYRHLLAGCERADSFVVNPHKWFFVPVDCSVLLCREHEAIREALSLVPAYLMTAEHGVARNLMDYGPALGRRFRALKLWMVLRYFGAEGMADRVRHHVQLSQEFCRWVDEAADWERLAPAPMSTVLYRHRPAGMDDEGRIAAHNEAIMHRVNATGRAFISQTRLGDRYTLRMSVGNLRTELSHLDRLWRLLREAADAVAAEQATSA